MSLQHAAKHLEKHGRNGDTMLVHMSPREVKSLNDLAMAHGGHLTINPHTGLAEAGFLQRLLPMVAGAALTATGVGAPMAALMVGGGYAAATGSLKKGLMAGLGAYGGAGLGTSLMQAGASSVAPEVAQEAAVSATPPPAAYTSPFEGTGVNASNFPKPALAEPFSVAEATPTPEYIPVSAPNPATSLRGNFANVQPLPSVTPAPLTTAQVTSATPEVSGLPPISTAAPTPESSAATTDPSKMRLKAPRGDVFNSNFSLRGQYINPEITAAQPGISAAAPATSPLENMTMGQRFEALKQGATFDNLMNYAKQNPMSAYSMGASLLMPDEKPRAKPKTDSDPGQQYTYEANATSPTPTADPYGTERKYYNQRYVARAAGGGQVEAMSNANAVGANTGYPMANIDKPVYAAPYQTPISQNVVQGTSDTGVNPMTGEMLSFARGGLSDAHYNLGSYSDGGRLLRGPGDGVSDSIPAVIGKKQPARLADGEFVVPARIVSELGNGSTEAGARKLYAMMDRIQKARGKTVGKGKVAKNSRSEKYLPA